MAEIFFVRGGGGGPPGPPNELLGRVPFTFATPSPLLILPLLAGDLLDIQDIVIEQSFSDLTATLQLGTVANPSLVLSLASPLGLLVNTYESSAKFLLAGPESLRLTINPAASAQGAGYVLYRVRR